MTPTYPLSLEQCHLPRYPVGPVPKPPNGQNTLPTEAGYSDGQAYPEPGIFNMGLEDLIVRGWGNTIIPEEAVNPWGTVPGNPLEQPFPSDVQPVLPPANQQTYDDYENRLFSMGNGAQVPQNEQGDADGNTGMAGEDLDDGRFEMFMEWRAQDLAGRQMPDGEAGTGLRGEMEVDFDGDEFERAMAQLTGGLETPRSMGPNSLSTETNAQLAEASVKSPGTNAPMESNAQFMETDDQPAEAGVQSSEIDAQLEQDFEQAEEQG